MPFIPIHSGLTLRQVDTTIYQLPQWFKPNKQSFRALRNRVTSGRVLRSSPYPFKVVNQKPRLLCCQECSCFSSRILQHWISATVSPKIYLASACLAGDWVETGVGGSEGWELNRILCSLDHFQHPV